MMYQYEWPEVKKFIEDNTAPYSYLNIQDVKYIVSSERYGLIVQCVIVKDDDPAWYNEFKLNYDGAQNA